MLRLVRRMNMKSGLKSKSAGCNNCVWIENSVAITLSIRSKVPSWSCSGSELRTHVSLLMAASVGKANNSCNENPGHHHHHGHQQPPPTSQSCQYGAKAPQAALRLCLRACAFPPPPHPTPRCATAFARIKTKKNNTNTCRFSAQTITDGKTKRANSAPPLQTAPAAGRCPRSALRDSAPAQENNRFRSAAAR